MELLLVRHAQPVRLEARTGRADPPLHPDGTQQSRRLAGWLAAEPLDALYTSPALRARQTAALLAQRLDLAPRIRDGLDEFDREEPSYVPVEELRATGDPRWEGRCYAESSTRASTPTPSGAAWWTRSRRSWPPGRARG